MLEKDKHEETDLRVHYRTMKQVFETEKNSENQQGDKLEGWAISNYMMFNKEKYQILPGMRQPWM